jgi:hypothetical protein
VGAADRHLFQDWAVDIEFLALFEVLLVGRTALRILVKDISFFRDATNSPSYP